MPSLPGRTPLAVGRPLCAVRPSRFGLRIRWPGSASKWTWSTNESNHVESSRFHHRSFACRLSVSEGRPFIVDFAHLIDCVGFRWTRRFTPRRPEATRHALLLSDPPASTDTLHTVTRDRICTGRPRTADHGPRTTRLTMAQDEALQLLQQTVWDARLPLEIRLAAAECRTFDQADPYLVSEPTA